MGIEWFRDLTIIIMGFVTVAALIFASILFYRLYRKAKSVLQLAESTMQSANEIVTLVKDFIKPALPIMTIIQVLKTVDYDPLKSILTANIDPP